VAVNYGLPAGTYLLELQPERGNVIALGHMDIDAAGRGFWAGNSDLPIGGGATVALVDDAGVVTCHGTLATRQ